MNGVMGRVLGEGWASLHPGLQAHHRLGATCDDGHMDVEFPWFMRPVLAVLGGCGILVNRAEAAVHTVVHKHMEAEGLQWRRTLTFANGRRLHFNSVWTSSRDGELVEYVNRVLGLRMAVRVVEGRLHYEGLSLVLRWGQRCWHVPEWLGLGHTVIEEVGLDDTHFRMDFRLIHPWFGQVFRYAGRFEAR